jgi:hypothetical protein
MGAGRFTFVAMAPFGALPMLFGPAVLFIAEGVPALPTAGPFPFPTVPAPFFPATGVVPVLPDAVAGPVLAETVPGAVLPTDVPGLVAFVVPGLAPVIDGCSVVEGRTFEGREAGALT